MSEAVAWDSPSIILQTKSYGEASLLVTLFSRDYGVWRAMVRGGNSRKQRVQWQAGVICLARWRAKANGQLGFFTAEVVHNPASFMLDYPLSLAMLSSACALVVDSLPEKEPYGQVFSDLVAFLSQLMVVPEDRNLLFVYFRWEASLLAALGYGLDLSCCAVTGQKDNLRYVSPRSGRAVSEEGAGQWKDRLLPLPSFLLEGEVAQECQSKGQADILQWWQAQALLGYFFHNIVFATHHRPSPAARLYLVEHLDRMKNRA